MPIKYYTEKEYDELCAKYSRMKSAFIPFIKKGTTYERQKEIKGLEKSYTFIPNDLNGVLTLLMKLEEDIKKTDGQLYKMKFIDAGCGNGWVVWLAYRCLFLMPENVCGIDLDPENIKFAKELYGEISYHEWFKDRFKVKDIFKENYKKYNIVYYYCPIKDKKLQQKFEKKVEREIKKGSYIIACLKQDKTFEKRKNIKVIFNSGHNYVLQKV